jgi:hypothetical protein
VFFGSLEENGAHLTNPSALLLFNLAVEKDKEIVYEDGFAVPFDPEMCFLYSFRVSIGAEGRENKSNISSNTPSSQHNKNGSRLSSSILSYACFLV